MIRKIFEQHRKILLLSCQASLHLRQLAPTDCSVPPKKCTFFLKDYRQKDVKPKNGNVSIITVPKRLTNVMICPFSSSSAWIEGAIEAIAEETADGIPAGHHQGRGITEL
jgi:hypothetical protein